MLNLISTSISGKLKSESPGPGNSSRPLHSESVNLLRADVAGEHRRAIGSNADLGLAAPGRGTRQVLQAGEGFHFVIGEPDAKSLWFCAPGGVVHILVIRCVGPVDDGTRLRQ